MQSPGRTARTGTWIITRHAAVTSQQQDEFKFRASDRTLKCCCGDFFFFLYMQADILISVAFTHRLSAQLWSGTDYFGMICSLRPRGKKHCMTLSVSSDWNATAPPTSSQNNSKMCTSAFRTFKLCFFFSSPFSLSGVDLNNGCFPSD